METLHCPVGILQAADKFVDGHRIRLSGQKERSDFSCQETIDSVQDLAGGQNFRSQFFVQVLQSRRRVDSVSNRPVFQMVGPAEVRVSPPNPLEIEKLQSGTRGR